MIQENPPTPPSPFRRTEDFVAEYANNVQLEVSVWDLKIIFGQLDQSNGQTIEQHAAITIPWTTAKILTYYLEAQIAAYESDYREIHIPSNVVPPLPEGLPDDLADNDLAQSVLNYVKSLHRRFFRSHHRMADSRTEQEQPPPAKPPQP